jgi:phosphoenolpyruvate carboxylase
MNELRDQIELVWMTGELHLEKATVEREVAWGLHFFDETLFEMLPETLEALHEALAETYPGTEFRVPPFFQFGSWIGGDRDGNPYVTAAVTRQTLHRNALASLTRYRDRVRELGRTLSLTERSLPLPEGFRAELDRQLAESGQARAITRRNPGEPYRQYLSCVLRKIEATIARNEGEHPSGPDYASADGLIEDLRTLERGLTEAKCGALARDLVRPVRRMVEIFRFSTVRLDLRENTTRTTDTLHALWRQRNGDGEPPALGSAAWRQWLDAELAPAARSRAVLRGSARRRPRDARHLRPRGRDARGPRPRGVRRLRAVDDPLGGGRARRVPAGQGGGGVPRRRRHGDLPAADRAPVRDHRRPARPPRRSCGRCSGRRWCAARPAGRAGCRR